MKRKNAKRYSYIFTLILVIAVLFYLGVQSLPNIDQVLDYLQKGGIHLLKRDVKIYFSPKGGAQDALIGVIDSAKDEILVAMYYFTSRPLAQAILRAKKRNVSIRILLDESQLTEKYSKYRYLSSNGIRIRIDRRKGLMHNKFMIVDGTVLATGSYNWTSSAEHKNRENLLIIKNKALAQRYIWEFKKLWTSSSP